MLRLRYMFITLTAVALLLFGGATHHAEAREGWYVGGGLADQSVSGGLDGNKDFSNSAGTVVILAGKPDAGTGWDLVVGYGINKILSVEGLIADTSHTASHSAVTFKSNMDLVTSLIGVKASYQPMDNLEVYGRAGLATATATYAKYALHGTTTSGTFTFSSTSEASFDGSGFGAGGGVEYMIDHIGLSANYNLLSVKFDQAHGGSTSGKLPSELSSTISQFDFNVTYYFR